VLASREGRIADEAILILLWLVMPIFTFVVAVVAYSMVRFRARDGSRADSAAQLRGDGRFSWSWVGATGALAVVVTIYPGITGLRFIWQTRSAPDPLVVNVTATQWEWRFEYPRQGLSGQEELVLPVRRPVRFVLRSNDVIHSFWIPAFRIKDDAVPGEERDLYLTPDRTVSTMSTSLARVQCAELCGIGHADMRAAVRVVPPSAFEAWVRRQKRMQAAGG
jgi:cytochrome c oxidase subunit 2